MRRVSWMQVLVFGLVALVLALGVGVLFFLSLSGRGRRVLGAYRGRCRPAVRARPITEGVEPYGEPLE